MTAFDPTFAWKLGAVPYLAWPSRVLSKTNIPPTAPVTNDSHIVGKNPTGEWIDKENQIAIRTSEGAWFYQVPTRGRRVYVQAIKTHREFNGREWVPEAGGLPPGGLLSYVLTKQSDADGDAIWVAPGLIGGGGGGGTTVKLFAKVETITGSASEGDLAVVLGQGLGAYPERGTVYQWITGGWTHVGSISQAGVPEGGLTGQILAKSSDSNFEVEWLDLEDAVGDITAVTAGEGITGGGSSGSVTLAINWGVDHDEVRHGNDAAYTDARTPTGSAGGDLGATYPSPSVIAVTADSTRLAFGTIADGEFIQRSGTTLVGASGASAPQPVQVDGSLVGTRDAIDIVAGTGITLSGTDDSSSNRVRVTINATGGGGGGGGGAGSFPFLATPSSPDAWDMDCSTWSSPDIATNGWTITQHTTPFTVLTRAGDVNVFSGVFPSSGTYRSTLVHGQLWLQLPTTNAALIYKATSSADYTYRALTRHNRFVTGNNAAVFVSDATSFNTGTNSFYYTGVEGLIVVDVLNSGAGAFTLYTSSSNTVSELNSVKYLRVVSGTYSAFHIDAGTGREVFPATSHTISLVPAYAGLLVYVNNAKDVAYIDYLRRQPVTQFP